MPCAAFIIFRLYRWGCSEAYATVEELMKAIRAYPELENGIRQTLLENTISRDALDQLVEKAKVKRIAKAQLKELSGE